MAKITWKGSAQLSPIPAALVTCGTAEKPNVFTVAWTGIICSKPPRTYISVRPERFSHGIIAQSGEFAINLTTSSLARATDYCGVRSGRNEDKIAACGLHLEEGEKISAPILAESPLSLECKVFDRIVLGSHEMFLADIVAVRVDEKCVAADGRLDLSGADILAYTHGEYHTLSKTVGTFGWSVKKPKKRRKPTSGEKKA